MARLLSSQEREAVARATAAIGRYAGPGGTSLANALKAALRSRLRNADPRDGPPVDALAFDMLDEARDALQVAAAHVQGTCADPSVRSTYAYWAARFRLRSLHSDEELAEALRVLDELRAMARSARLGDPEGYMDALKLVIKDYDRRRREALATRVGLRLPGDAEPLRYVLLWHGRREADLGPGLGWPPARARALLAGTARLTRFELAQLLTWLREEAAVDLFSLGVSCADLPDDDPVVHPRHLAFGVTADGQYEVSRRDRRGRAEPHDAPLVVADDDGTPFTVPPGSVGYAQRATRALNDGRPAAPPPEPAPPADPGEPGFVTTTPPGTNGDA